MNEHTLTNEQRMAVNFDKLINSRFLTLMGDPQLREVLGKFGTEPFRRSSVIEGFISFVENQKFSGERCVEIGTWCGLTAIILARHFKEVITIDTEDHPLKRQILDHLGIDNVLCVEAGSREEKAAILRDLPFDAAYLDGDHTNDTEFDFDLVSRCQRVMFHEYWPPQQPVWQLVNRLKDAGDRVTWVHKFALWVHLR